VAEPVTLPLPCAHCHGAVEVQLEYVKGFTVMEPVSYQCPYCHKRNAFKAPGRILLAVKRER
jgi:hypothetical protein